MKNFKLKKAVGSLIAVGLLSCYNVSAFAASTCPESLDPASDYNCFFLDVGTSYNNTDSDSLTSNFFEFGYTGQLATSIYEAGVANGSTIIDASRQEVLNYYGLVGSGTHTAIDTVSSVLLKDIPDSPVERAIKSLTGPNPVDTEGFDPTESFSPSWGMTYDYFLEGKTDDVTGLPSFSSGHYDFFFTDKDTGDTEQVLRINVESSDLKLANLSLFGTVSYDWTNNNGDVDKYGLATTDGLNDCISTLCQNFFNLQNEGNPISFFDYLGLGPNHQINFELDSNVNPPTPTPAQLVAFTGDDGNDYWIRQSTLDGSIRFVPEPLSFALMGLGLAGLGYSKRRRN